MNAPIHTLSAMPAAIQREHDEALQTFWKDGSARQLHLLEGRGMGIAGKRSMPDKLEWVTEYTHPFWRASTTIDGRIFEGESPNKAALALLQMLWRVEDYVSALAQERYEENMAEDR